MIVNFGVACGFRASPRRCGDGRLIGIRDCAWQMPVIEPDRLDKSVLAEHPGRIGPERSTVTERLRGARASNYPAVIVDGPKSERRWCRFGNSECLQVERAIGIEPTTFSLGS